MCVSWHVTTSWQTMIFQRALWNAMFSNEIETNLLKCSHNFKLMFFNAFSKSCCGCSEGNILAQTPNFYRRVCPVKFQNQAVTNGFGNIWVKRLKNVSFYKHFWTWYFHPGKRNVWCVVVRAAFGNGCRLWTCTVWFIKSDVFPQ